MCSSDLESYFNTLVDEFKNETGCIIDSIEVQKVPIPRKTRFIEPFKAQRMFEIYKDRKSVV